MSHICLMENGVGEPLKVLISKRLEAVRVTEGWSVAEMARQMGVSYTTYKEIKRTAWSLKVGSRDVHSISLKTLQESLDRIGYDGDIILTKRGANAAADSGSKK